MSLGFSRSGSWILLSLLVVGGLGVNHANAQGNQRPRRMIELSETNSAEILTNLNQVTTRKEGLRQLEEQLKSLKGLSTGNSLEDRFSAPYLAPTKSLSNKSFKDILEKQNNWNLAAEEVNNSGNSPDSNLFPNPGDDKKDDKKDNKTSSLQQFYDTLNRQSSGRKTPDRFNENKSANSTKVADLRDDDPKADDSQLPDGIRDKAQKLKEIVTEDSTSIFSPTHAKSSFDNFFGLSEGPTKDSLDGTKNSMESFIDQFKKALDAPSSASSSGGNLNPSLKSLLADPAARGPGSLPGMNALPTPATHEFTESSFGNLNSILNRTAMRDINSSLLNQWNPMFAAPKFEPPKFTAPTPPPSMMDFPRRRF